MLSQLILSLALVSSLNSPDQLKDYITYRAIDYGVNPTLALSIIEAESNFNPNAKNKSSTASGLAQFIDGTAQGFCINEYKLATSLAEKNNPYLQIECLVRMLSNDGLKHWNASKVIWEKQLAMET